MTEQQFNEDRLVDQVYQSFEREHPSSDTDREILARALDVKTAKPSSPFAGNWKVPLSLAAVFVVALAVVLRLGVSPKDTMPVVDEIRMKQAAPAPQAEPAGRAEKDAVTMEEAPAAAMTAPAAPVEMKAEQESLEKKADVGKQKESSALVDEMEDVAREADATVKTYGSMADFMSAEFWVQEIRSLYARGLEDLARKELVVFKEAFPDYDASELERLLGN